MLAKIVPGALSLLVSFQPVDAYEAKFTEAEAKLLEVKWGEASSQGPLEALGLWRGDENVGNEDPRKRGPCQE